VHASKNATYKKDIESTVSKRVFQSQRMFRGLGTHIADEYLLRPSLFVTAGSDGRGTIFIYTL